MLIPILILLLLLLILLLSILHATTNTNQSKPNFRATDSQTQESALAGSGFSPAGNREQETISMDEIHSSSYTTNL